MEDDPRSLDPSILSRRIDAALLKASAALLDARVPEGHWEGELSSSALSTATAVTALAIVERESQISKFNSQIHSGLAWLAQHRNADGGWGDTVLSVSNLSTTALCWAAFGAVPGADQQYQFTVARAQDWLTKRAGGLTADKLPPAIIQCYGKDRTFSAPIIAMCALAGRLGPNPEAWQWVIPLPFELAVCPHQWFAALRLPVVSYALPALIAIGQARHFHRPTRNPALRLIRRLTRGRSLRILAEIQPSSGGFLEATPLTSFVTMSLAGSGEVNHVVTKRGVEFLLKSQRADGSWPIDTNLATWLTTLAVDALADTEQFENQKSKIGMPIRSWLLAQQHRCEHPYTHAAPGGWAWTDLPGGVPDADDTAGALIALRKLCPVDAQTREAAVAGIKWLFKLQNRDGGLPTFCRGWGALPFDRSSADIAAHAIRAWLAWLDQVESSLQTRIEAAIRHALTFLARMQRRDGSWTPLWFGNQFVPNEENPIYGTARVLSALACVRARSEVRTPLAEKLYHSGVNYLVRSQNADGGWGGDVSNSSVEETALAIQALARANPANVSAANPACAHGVTWLLEQIENGGWTQPSPIGFYFAKLWYYERLYPVIFTVDALKHALRYLRSPDA